MEKPKNTMRSFGCGLFANLNAALSCSSVNTFCTDGAPGSGAQAASSSAANIGPLKNRIEIEYFS